MSDPIRDAFDRDALARICSMDERDFAAEYGMTVVAVDQPAPDDFYAYRDNGSGILAVAHLDTVSDPGSRAATFIDTAAGPVVYSRALDDRLGAYIILDLLPKLGVDMDILLTVGEETGQSTAAFFEPDKEFDWMIEFDRGGTDVVMYQYEDACTIARVEETGAIVGDGIFSDICYLEHLGVKGFNWGVGYRDYHTARSHAYIDDTLRMVGYFLDFYAMNVDRVMPHVHQPQPPLDEWWTHFGYRTEPSDDTLAAEWG
jgi:M42 glutamyl aminopeptidase